MRIKMLTVIAAFFVAVFGFSSMGLNALEPMFYDDPRRETLRLVEANIYDDNGNVVGTQFFWQEISGSAPFAMPSSTEIQHMLTDMLPSFEDFYGYCLMTELNRTNLTLADFSSMLHNYLMFLYDINLLDEQEFDITDENWLFYFLDGIVIEMSESDMTAWGNVSLKGLVLNDIYANALGLNLLSEFFSHYAMMRLGSELEIAAYFDFLMRDSSIAAVLPFGAAARVLLENGETELMTEIIGYEDVSALANMGNVERLNFLAGHLIDRIAPNIDDIIAEYADFLVIPSPNIAVSIHIGQDNMEERFGFTLFSETTFSATLNADDANINIFLSNTSTADFYKTIQTYNAAGEWHIFANELVPAGQSFTRQLRFFEDFGDILVITVFSASDAEVSGEFAIRATTQVLQ
ncbi:MAG: hypothetical protein FWE34_01915 [Defluviitaleaceae bacterium]|nr:hypothetical protein [Defluviitaleaceae bacterium]